MGTDIEDRCEELRQAINKLKEQVADLHEDGIFDELDESLPRGNVATSRNEELHSNITLAFRHLEDARMRLGKVMQAAQGGVSILDK